MNDDRGTFREIEHTADLGIETTAADLPRLFAATGEGLFSLIADPENIDPREPGRRLGGWRRPRRAAPRMAAGIVEPIQP